MPDLPWAAVLSGLMRRLALTLFALCACTLFSCTAGGGKGSGEGLTVEQHSTLYFPITEGTNHALGSKVTGCESCHPPARESFKDFTCVSCHIHDEGISEQLHRGVPDYAFGERTCYTCHPIGKEQDFSHTGIATNGCAVCHEELNPFAALPPVPPKPAGWVHPPKAGSDCGSCHPSTVTWQGASLAPNDARDPLQDLVIDALVPDWSGTTIRSVTQLNQALPMRMNHMSAQYAAAANSACANCHADAQTGVYYPGLFHSSLVDLGLPEPTGCTDCHAETEPVGFVGPLATSPARTPPTGEMRHEAVGWANGLRGTTRLVTQDCQLCHRAPTAAMLNADWSSSRTDGGSPARYHAAMPLAQQPQSCLDCHANSRPVALLSLRNGLQFDHQASDALGDCRACHGDSRALSGTAWDAGTFHGAGQPAPATCLPCHEGERPVANSTAGWLDTTFDFQKRPFDYGTNSRGIKHGANQDCIVCHTRTQDWTGGNFVHGPTTLSGTQCISCHTTQRPDTQAAAIGFDHLANGTGDCFGCHQDTVTPPGRYASYNNPATNMLPGGDWRGGVAYPGSFISSNDRFITVTETTLNRTGGLVTSTTSVQTTLYNGMLHTSTVLRPELSAGPTTMPDYAKCWHCHATDAGYTDGVYHEALRQYRATMGGAVTVLPQPTSQCNDCHSNMWPRNIVQRGTTNLQPMDHAAQFTAMVNIGGRMVNRVNQLDCSTCHADPGGSWADAGFHAVTGSATPTDCVQCHYPLMADAPKSDVTSAPTYKMAHRSGVITFQACERCHPTALAQSRTAPTPLATTWRTGAYHGSSLAAQPAACNDCHNTVSRPATTTQGTVSYALAQGMTATNQAQWMNHASAVLTGRDCAVCHAADARATGSAWSKAAKVHGPLASVTTCNECHGITNGRGTTVGTNNNMPAGLTDTATVTTASAATGVPAGTHDQIAHTDLNVTGKECRFCHTQQGASTNPMIAGKEWAQAAFHRNFTGANPLVTNGTTARCSNCHLNVKPGAAYTAFNHAAYTATSPQDCSSCHSWPGTNPAAPNWRGATGAHAASGSTAASVLDCNTCHGQGGAANTRLMVPAASHYGGVANGNRCISCHIEFSGFKGTVANLKYAHNNATANAGGCQVCHPFSGGLYTLLTTTPSLTLPTSPGAKTFSQSQTVTGRENNDTGPPRGSFTSNHNNAGLVRCGSCHRYTATTATTNVWTWQHDPNNPGISNSRNTTSGCTMCHL